MNNLFDLKIGSCAHIKKLTAKGSMRRRLLDLGFVPGAPVRCLFSGPGGDPRAYLIKNTVIALRNVDAKTILLHKGDQE